MVPLYEEFRPTAFSDVVGQDKALRRVDALRARGLGGRAFWITGGSGTGKTTIGRLIAAEVAEDWLTTETDGDSLSVGDVADMERDFAMKPLGKGAAYIIDEAHRLSARAIARLLVVLERIPSWACVVFTTTSEAHEDLFAEKLDASPLLSRCIELKLARKALCAPFAKRAHEAADAIGLNGAPDAEYVKLARKHKNNLRAMMQDIEAGCMVP